jgi:nitrate/nitrite transport system ATP-binding protein
MDKYLELWKLRKTYPSPTGPVDVVLDFDLNLREGEFVSLIGHSGCGKSTVLSMVAGLTEKNGGSIILANKEVFQSPCLLPWLSAFDNVMLAVNQVYFEAPQSNRDQVARYYLELVGLKESMHKKPAELSSGMRQRVGIARAFSLSPKILLLDEPFGMLDSLTRMELQEVLLELWRADHKTALMITHDVDEALFLSDRVAMMTSGPAAKVGGIIKVDFPRPRIRQDVLDHPDYYPLREQIIAFLEDHTTSKWETLPVAAKSTPLLETAAIP